MTLFRDEGAGGWYRQNGGFQFSVFRFQFFVFSGRLPVVGCQWSVASGRLPVVGCQWSVASGQLPVVSCQELQGPRESG